MPGTLSGSRFLRNSYCVQAKILFSSLKEMVRCRPLPTATKSSNNVNEVQQLADEHHEHKGGKIMDQAQAASRNLRSIRKISSVSIEDRRKCREEIEPGQIRGSKRGLCVSGQDIGVSVVKGFVEVGSCSGRRTVRSGLFLVFRPQNYLRRNCSMAL
jgi:hypothetical protein